MSFRGGSRRKDRSTSLFVRNIAFEARADDIRKVFSRYGYVRDVYIPLDYYTKEPRGFAYVEYEHTRDATDAMEELDGYRMMDRELEIVFAEGDRKNPNMMRRKDGPGRSSRRSRSRSRSPGRRRRDSRSPPRRRRDSRSPARRRRESRSPRSGSPRRGTQSRERGSSRRSLSPSPSREGSPGGSRSVSRSPSPGSPKKKRRSRRSPTPQSMSPSSPPEHSPARSR